MNASTLSDDPLLDIGLQPATRQLLDTLPARRQPPKTVPPLRRPEVVARLAQSR